MRRWPLVWQFSLLSLACLSALWVVLGLALNARIEGRATHSAGEAAALLADVGLRADLVRGGRLATRLDAEQRRTLDRVVGDGHRDVAGLALIDRRGRVLYATPALRAPTSRDVGAALAGERSVAIAGSGDDRLLDAYVPLRGRAGQRPLGALRIAMDYGPVAAGVAHDLRTIGVILAAGLILLWLALFRFVASTSKRLGDQAGDAERQARIDELTGLPNRRALDEHLAKTLTEAAAARMPAALLVLDLDGFKELNDTLGHRAGDQLLTALGPRLAKALPASALIARLGGDEFAIALAAGSDRGAALDAAARVRRALDDPFQVADLRLAVRASIGVARYPHDGTDSATLLRCADIAMYDAKKAGSGSAQYDASRDGNSRTTLTMGTELTRALASDQLLLHYQPKMDLATGKIGGVEALVRWQHPQHDLLAPDAFLPVAQRTGAITQVTRQVLHQALAQCKAWSDISLPLRVAVNVTAESLLDESFPEVIAYALKRHKVDPSLLQIELTETSVLADPVRVGRVLAAISALGVGISLDDFGTGFSSLSHLKDLTVDELKIDRSFISNLEHDSRDAAIVASTIDLGRALGLRVVAEGVEDDATLDRLTGLGCDVAQGYILSRPIPAADLTYWAIRRRLATTKGASQRQAA